MSKSNSFYLFLKKQNFNGQKETVHLNMRKKLFYNQLFNKITLDFDKLYTNVMKIDSTIRYAVIQNNTGEKICGGFRESIDPLLDDDELKMMHYYASQRWHTRKNIEHKLGNTKYAMAEYDKLKRITFPINEKYMLLLTTEIISNHTEIIKSVLNLINDFKDR